MSNKTTKAKPKIARIYYVILFVMFISTTMLGILFFNYENYNNNLVTGIEQLVNNKIQLQKNNDYLLTYISDLNNRLEECETSINQYETTISELNSEIEQINEYKESYSDLSFQYDDLQSKYDTLNSEHNDLASKYDELLSKNQNLENQLNTYKSLSNGSSGTSSSSSSGITSDNKSSNSQSSSTQVYITKTGSKYHRGSCGYLSRSKIPISKSSAISQGYTACSRCNP